MQLSKLKTKLKRFERKLCGKQAQDDDKHASEEDSDEENDMENGILKRDKQTIPGCVFS